MKWTLSRGIKLLDIGVPIYFDRAALESFNPAQPRVSERPPAPEAPPEVEAAVWETYKRPHLNALSLLEDAEVLLERGRYARAFALACTELEEDWEVVR